MYLLLEVKHIKRDKERLRGRVTESRKDKMHRQIKGKKGK
jgi:hypothetical protein